jgi:hypothetical protein
LFKISFRTFRTDKSMKNFLRISAFFLVIILSYDFANALSLELTYKDEQVSGTIDDEIIAYATVKNTSSMELNVRCDITMITLGENHSLTICWENCFSNIKTDFTLGNRTIAAAGNSGPYFDISLNPNNTPDTTIVKIKFTNTMDEEDFVEFQSTLIATSVSGVDDAAEAHISVFPNPTADFIQISMPQTVSETTKFEIYTSCGSLVKSIEAVINGSAVVIPVSDLTDGMYFVSFIASDNRKVLRAFAVTK